MTDKTAKQAAEHLGVTSEAPVKALVLVELPELTLDSPKYTEAQNQLAKADKGSDRTEHVCVHSHAYYPPAVESAFSFTH